MLTLACCASTHSLRVCPLDSHSLSLASGFARTRPPALSDTSVSVWDVRKLSEAAKGLKPLCAVSHDKSCQAAFFCPDGSRRLLTTSWDNTLRVWSNVGKKGAADLEEAVSIEHDNNTGRWVIPFRASWAPTGDAIFCGACCCM